MPTCHAYAKINWALNIVGRRPDGYHLLDMLMQTIDLADELTLEPADDLTLTVDGVTAGEENLVLRAAMALNRHAGTRFGAAMALKKRVPARAGMGGGSADAAAVIAGLNRLWQLSLDQREMEAVGLTVGADVPFCLRGGLCRVTGIGEEMRSLPYEKHFWLVITQPCRGLSTKAVFEAYAQDNAAPRPLTDRAQAAFEAGEILPLKTCLHNVLEPVSRAMRPQIGQAVDLLKANGALTALMTGSGSAVFGVFLSAPAARLALGALPFPVKYMAHTCRESLAFEE